ncbi:MAG: hypothetical protein N3D77_13115 [Geminicoccaceae bacterium]|nr:hypothetical protein [Geminicoccaceae bacterium]
MRERHARSLRARWHSAPLRVVERGAGEHRREPLGLEQEPRHGRRAHEAACAGFGSGRARPRDQRQDRLFVGAQARAAEREQAKSARCGFFEVPAEGVEGGERFFEAGQAERQAKAVDEKGRGGTAVAQPAAERPQQELLAGRELTDDPPGETVGEVVAKTLGRGDPGHRELPMAVTFTRSIAPVVARVKRLNAERKNNRDR